MTSDESVQRLRHNNRPHTSDEGEEDGIELG